MPSPQSRRILFAIRSKLGDTLISYACVRAYADAHPHETVTLLTRTAYAQLLRAETGLRVIGFNSRVEMFFKLLWLRLTEPTFDVLAVLWGSGAPVRRIGKWVKAKRKIAWSKRFAPTIFEEPNLPADPLLVQPAACTVRVFDPAFVTPQTLHIPSLARRYHVSDRLGHKRAIGIAPIADELRRNLDLPALTQLVAEVQRRHAGAAIRIFINPGNDGAQSLVHQHFEGDVAICTFTRLDELLEQYMGLDAWYGTDTGLYHLAVSIGIPSTVFFGPTQPHKIVMPAQQGVTVRRLTVLGDTHCDEKDCARPLCLHLNVAQFAQAQTATQLDETPAACPLRQYPSTALTRVSELQRSAASA